jgi:hypothetical protein
LLSLGAALSLARLVADPFLCFTFASVAALKVKDVSEIHWENVGDANLQRHGSKNLRDRWRRLRIKAAKQLGNEKLTHAGESFLLFALRARVRTLISLFSPLAELVAYQLQRYPVRGSSAKARKIKPTAAKKKGKASPYKSAEFIEDSDDDDGEGGGASSSEDEEGD